MKEIQLSQGLVALVDDEDYESLIQHKWSATKGRNTYYAIRNVKTVSGKKTQIKMHVQISGKKGIDHADNNGLNNQKFNFREANNREQAANSAKYLTANGKPTTSIFKGVSLCRRNNKWCSQISISSKPKFLGYFLLEVEAAKRYDEEADKLFGEFARLNFPKNTNP